MALTVLPGASSQRTSRASRRIVPSPSPLAGRPKARFDAYGTADSPAPPIARLVSFGVAREDFGSIVPRINRDGHEAQVSRLCKFALELRHLEALRRTRLGALGVDEVDQRDVIPQVLAGDQPPGPFGEREGGDPAVVTELLQAPLVGARCEPRRFHPPHDDRDHHEGNRYTERYATRARHVRPHVTPSGTASASGYRDTYCR